ncbi:hypothetical protein LguiA_009787 [Lonicera macranthoides]
MALLHCKFNNTELTFPSPSIFRSLHLYRLSSPSSRKIPTFSPSIVRSLSTSNHQNEDSKINDPNLPKKDKKLSEQSSWEAKDSEGEDYLYRLGKESDNMNIAVGARAGVIDDLFTGTFLGRDSDIVFDYRQKVTRSFEYLKGDYYIAPFFMDKIVCHIVKNYIAHLLNTKVPLILDIFTYDIGVWGGKGQGKSFQTELIFQAMGVEPIIMSAGELESERAGEPGKLIRERYRTASQVVQNQGKMSCLMINDIDAGLGRFGELHFNLDQERLIKWQPTHEDIINIVYRMYERDGISRDQVVSIVNTFPNQALDFYGALRSRTYDRSILEVSPNFIDGLGVRWGKGLHWVDDIGGIECLGKKLLKRRKDENLPVFVPPKTIFSTYMMNLFQQQTIEALLESGNLLIQEQKLIMETKLSKEYLKNLED